MSEAVILARAIHIAATTLATGTVTFMVLVAEPAFGASRTGAVRLAALRRRCNIIIWSALAIALASGAAWLALLTADIYGQTVLAVCLHGGLWTVLTETRFGAAWTARLGLALLLALLVAWPATRTAQLAVAAAFAGALAFVGHAGATPGGAGQIHLASDVTHLIAASAWLGGLPALAIAMIAGPERNAARAAARFSVLGIAAVGTLVASGLINSWNLVGSVSDLIDTGYGRLLALKLGLFATMLGIVAVNRFHLTPLLKAKGARRALARNSLAETGLGLVVLLLVGALGTLPPTTHNLLPPVDIPPDAAFVHLHGEEVMADVMIDPGRTGTANALLRVMREDTSRYPTDRVEFALEAPSAGFPPVRRKAARQADGTWRIEGIDIGQSGIWTVRLTIARENGGAPTVLDGPIVIGQ